MPRQNDQKDLEDIASKLRISELRLFVQVAKQGNFTSAARRLGITQATASKQLKKLEESLDLLLIERAKKPLQLTPLGEQFLQFCQPIVDHFDSAIHFVQSEKTQPAGDLTIAMKPWLFKALAASFFTAFMSKYPLITPHLVFPSADRMSGETDTDIVINPLLPATRKLKAHSLGFWSMDFYASRGYLERYPDLDHPSQLVQHPCYCVDQVELQTGELLWTDDKGQSHSLMVKPALVFEDLEVGFELAKQGTGITWCPERLVDVIDRDGELVRVFGGRFKTPFTLYAMHSRQAVVPPKIRVFIQELRKAIVR